MGMNKWYFRLARQVPWLLAGSMNVVRRLPVNSVPPQWITGVPIADYALLNNVERFAALARLTLKEAARQGARGPLHEARSYYHPFGFSLAAIRQPVHYWWGSSDMSVIRLHAEAVENEVPQAVMHYREGEGHLSLYVNYFTQVLQEMVSHYNG